MFAIQLRSGVDLPAGVGDRYALFVPVLFEDLLLLVVEEAELERVDDGRIYQGAEEEALLLHVAVDDVIAAGVLESPGYGEVVEGLREPGPTRAYRKTRRASP